MAGFDIIELEFPDFRSDVEDWLWLDRRIPKNHARLVKTEQIVNSLLRHFGCSPDLMNEAQKAECLFQKIGMPEAFALWSDPD